MCKSYHFLYEKLLYWLKASEGKGLIQFHFDFEFNLSSHFNHCVLYVYDGVQNTEEHHGELQGKQEFAPLTMNRAELILSIDQ